MNFLISLLGKFNKPMLLVIVGICAIIVTLTVAGIIHLDPSAESTANSIIKQEIGIDLEQAEEEFSKKS